MLFIAEVLRDRQAGQGHSQAGARRFVHLAVDQGNFRFPQVLLVDDPRSRHFTVQIVSLTSPFADSGKYRHAAVKLRDVVDQLLDEDRFADSRAAESADLASSKKGAYQVDHLDARGQHFIGS